MKTGIGKGALDPVKLLLTIEDLQDQMVDLLEAFEVERREFKRVRKTRGMVK